MASERSTQRVLLVLTACLLLAFGLARLLEREPAPEASPPAAAPAATDAPDAGPEPVAEAAPPAPDASGIPHTKLPLRLLATVVGEDPTLSLATIADEERGANAVMKEGQAFQARPAVRVAAIERARVLLDNDGVREQLVLLHHEPGPAEPVHEITREEREFRRDLARRLRDLTDRGADALAPPERGGLLAEGDVNAAYEDGELIGVHIEDIRAGGLYDRIGLRNGDLVTGINGVSLRDPGAMAKVVAMAATSPVLEITVERPDGPPTTVSLPTAELEPLVAGE